MDIHLLFNSCSLHDPRCPSFPEQWNPSRMCTSQSYCFGMHRGKNMEDAPSSWAVYVNEFWNAAFASYHGLVFKAWGLQQLKVNSSAVTYVATTAQSELHIADRASVCMCRHPKQIISFFYRRCGNKECDLLCINAKPWQNMKCWSVRNTNRAGMVRLRNSSFHTHADYWCLPPSTGKHWWAAVGERRKQKENNKSVQNLRTDLWYYLGGKPEQNHSHRTAGQEGKGELNLAWTAVKVELVSMRDHSVHELEKGDQDDADEAAAFVLASVNKRQYEVKAAKMKFYNVLWM